MNMIYYLLKKKNPDLYKKLDNYGVNVEIIMVEWLYSLFSSLIPLEEQANFYLGFYSQGWNFFYKMCLSILQNLNLNIQLYDAEDIYICLKYGKNTELTPEEQKKQIFSKRSSILGNILKIIVAISILFLAKFIFEKNPFSDRKSGIPAEVLIPAPKRNAIFLNFLFLNNSMKF